MHPNANSSYLWEVRLDEGGRGECLLFFNSQKEIKIVEKKGFQEDLATRRSFSQIRGRPGLHVQSVFPCVL